MAEPLAALSMRRQDGKDMWTTVIFSLCLLTVSVILIRMHIRAWRATASSETTEQERQFGRDQFRRRITASSMIGLIGCSLPMMLAAMGGQPANDTVSTLATNPAAPR